MKTNTRDSLEKIKVFSKDLIGFKTCTGNVELTRPPDLMECEQKCKNIFLWEQLSHECLNVNHLN